jgi:hypothetical protein
VEVPETHIMAMKLEELCLVVGHGERMEFGTAEIVDVDDLHTFLPKQSIGTDEKRRSCKSWEELLAIEVRCISFQCLTSCWTLANTNEDILRLDSLKI